MSSRARILKILQNVNKDEEDFIATTETFTVQEDGSLVKENVNPNSRIIKEKSKNIYIFKDKSLRTKSDIIFENDKIDIGISLPTSPSILHDECSFINLEEKMEETTAPPIEMITEVPMEIITKATELQIDIAGTIEPCHEHATEPPIQIISGPTEAAIQIITQTSEPPTEIIEETTEPPTKRQKKCQPDRWTVNENKKNREKGKAYMGKKKVNEKWQFIESKPERQMMERCNCKLSKKNTKIKCDKITDGDRQKIWENFWQLTWNEKKIYVKSFSICKTKERVRSDGPTSRRNYSVELYLLSKCNKDRFRVCKKMFLNTLSIGEWAIKKWIIEEQENNEPKERPKNNKKTECMTKLRYFFDSLPKMESHYCRKDSGKLYLEPMWTSKNQLYKVYQNDFCKSNNLKPLSIASFHNLFDELNLSLYRPKKDLCEICEGFKTKNVPYDDYKKHIEKKDEARDEKKKDKKSNHLVMSMDLQSVLLSPKSNVSSLYYKTKLTVHNFTLCNVKTKKGHCFIWNETEGKLTANEFSTIIISAFTKFISETPLEKDQEIIIYSDGCTYQNRNAVLSNAILNFCMEHNVTVTQKYLEKGHTYMECDNMHSVIEKALKYKKINVPADYAHTARIASKKTPYDVTYLYHDFFKDIEPTLKFYKSIRPGKKVGDPTVTDLRALRYNPDGTILYKLRHPDTYKSFPTRISEKPCVIPFNSIPRLYSARIPIKREKYQHLQELKNTMEKDYHNFYDNLPHS